VSIVNVSSLAPIYVSGALASSTIPTAGTPEATYYYQVRVCDALSNCNDWSGPWMVVVDNTAPVITINNDVDAVASQADTINLTVTDAFINSSSLEYGFSADATCDGSDIFGNPFTTGVDFVVYKEIRLESLSNIAISKFLSLYKGLDSSNLILD